MKNSTVPSLFGTREDAPFAFHPLHKEMDRLFDDFRKMIPRFATDEVVDSQGLITPKLDVSETEDALKIDVELPGVEEKDIDLTVTGQSLVLSGEKSTTREEEQEGRKLVERSFGRYLRTLPLGFDINPDLVDAQFNNGVLAITVKKPPEAIDRSQKIKLSKSK